jgi:hypothetical protein
VNYYLLLPLILGVLLIGNVSSSFAQANSVDVIENKLVTLVGEGYDPDGNGLVFQWTQIYGEPVTLSSYTAPEPTFMAPEVKNGEIKVLTFELTVTDPLGATATDTVEVVVNPVNHAPVVDAGKDLVALPSVNAMSIIPTTSDQDGDKLTYNWEQLSGQSVDLSSTHQKYLTLLPMYLDYSQTDPLVFKITVDDGFGGTASDTVSVFPFTGMIENKLISIKASPLQTVTEGERVTLSATGTTSNGQPIRYSWVQLLGTPVTLSSFTGDTVQFTAPEVGDNDEMLSFQVTGYSPGNGWANALALVRVMPSNAPPVADAGKDQNVLERVTVKLDGTGTDPDGDRLKYSWTQKSGMPVDLYERAPFSVYFISPKITTSSEKLVFEFKVTDDHGNYDTDEANVTINTINLPPRAVAGPDMRVLGGSQVTVNGKGIDPDDDPLTYEWRQISGDAVTFDKSSPSFTFTAPDVLPTESKRLAFQLTVTDTQKQSASDQVVIFVVPENSSPIANAGPDMTVDENTLVNLLCTGTDPDNDIINFSWSSSANVEIADNTSPMTSIMAPSVVSDSQITMTCTVSDGSLTSSDSMVITVKNTLNKDIVADAGMDQIVNEQVKISLDGSKSYDPENQPISYMWSQVSGEKVTLSSTTTPKTSFTSPIVANGEIKVLTFELKVYDDNGRESTDTVTITVDPVNAPPQASATARQS